MNGLKTRIAPYGSKLCYRKIQSLLPPTFNYNTVILFPEERESKFTMKMESSLLACSSTWVCILAVACASEHLILTVKIFHEMAANWFVPIESYHFSKIIFEKNNIPWLFKSGP